MRKLEPNIKLKKCQRRCIATEGRQTAQ